MLNALNRAECYRDLAEECRRLTAISSSTQMRKRDSRMAEHYSLLAGVEQFVRSVLATAISSVVASGVALAQTTSSITDDVSNWTSKQWTLAKVERAKGKEKWTDCQKQSTDQNLTGPNSWSFLAYCMIS